MQTSATTSTHHSSSSSMSSASPPPPSSSASVSGFNCPSLTNPKTQDVFHSIVKGRKSWKTLRGGEVVWPPELEAALIEGLERYTPDDSRETRLLGRFPMRNRFISEYIYQKTGKRRTAKQVGSRLQQLRDTCGGRQLLKLLTPYRPQNRSPRPSLLNNGESSTGAASGQCDSDSNSDMSTPATPTEAHATLQSLLYRGVGGFALNDEPHNVVYIDLLPDSTPTNSGALPPSPPVPSTPGYNHIRASQSPRHIRDINPTVTLLANSSMKAKSHFIVRSRAGVIHSETTTMTLVGPVPDGTEGEVLYSTSLVPSFWPELCRSPDPTQYTIIQRVIQEPHNDTTSPLFSAAYKFTLPFLTGHHTKPSVPDNFTLSNPAIQGSPNIGFGLDDLLTLDSDFFNDLIPLEDKSMDLYDLDACLTADWRILSPATSASSESLSDIYQFEEGLMSPGSCFSDIPVIAL